MAEEFSYSLQEDIETNRDFQFLDTKAGHFNGFGVDPVDPSFLKRLTTDPDLETVDIEEKLQEN